jgi:transcriptional regulator with XRE-family HTH domain
VAVPARGIRQRLADAIRAKRELLELSQEEAAARAGFSVRYWRRLESDEPPAVSMEIVEQVINGLDWSWPELVAALSSSERAERGRDRERAERNDGDRARRLFDTAWRKATPREREIVEAGLRVIASKRSSR